MSTKQEIVERLMRYCPVNSGVLVYDQCRTFAERIAENAVVTGGKWNNGADFCMPDGKLKAVEPDNLEKRKA